ncbi:MAG: phenylalanine--tRNA ligase subunit beta [Candidatus Cloacimonetes bacterium]|nr:phenylalanine--tRNA ligase subunit beta [Candidatus Cloacimonadota bacterium]
MKISYSWLKEYIDLALTPEELQERLTFSGIEVEAVERLGEHLGQFIAARIQSKEPHPNADRLSVCQVFDGAQEFQVVCGAPNCAAGQIVPLAPVGAQLGDFVIKKAKLRGIESFGMICSEKELGLSDNQDGIMVLPEDTPVGQSLADVLKLRDVVFEVEITPNRADLLGMIGVARDLAAQLGKPLKLPEIDVGGARVMRYGYGRKLDLRTADEKQLQTIPDIGPRRANYIAEYRRTTGFENPESLLRVDKIGRKVLAAAQGSFLPFGEVQEVWQSIHEVLKLDNRDPERCPRYTARFIRNVTVGPSPEWLQDRLRAVGLRPINNIVDVTNFVMYEMGHPLHAFDYDLVADKTIVVRRADEGEEFSALDGETYKLATDDLVIADAQKPIALAGVIGGENSHITSATRDVVIESASFLYSGVRRTSGRHKIFTDSAFRFERDMSDQSAMLASERCAQLLIEVAGGTLYSGVLDSWPSKPQPHCVSLRPERVRAFLAVDIPDRRLIRYLEALGCRLLSRDEAALNFEMPYWRKDLTREIDLIEEIIRLHGYNNVPRQTVDQEIMDRVGFVLRRVLADGLVADGFFEVVNWAFCDPEALDWLNLADEDRRRFAPRLLNPVGARFALMQPTLLPGLLKCLSYNVNHGNRDLRLFEMTKVFFRQDMHLAEEEYCLSGLICGNRESVHWDGDPAPVDFFDMRGVVEGLLEHIGIEDAEWSVSQEPFYMQGMAADIAIGGVTVGSVGRLDTKVLERFGIETPVFAFDLSVKALRQSQPSSHEEFRPISKYPPVLRDISFTLDRRFSVEEVTKAMRAVQPDIIREVRLFDQFTGKQIAAGKRSLSFGLHFHSDAKTLTDDYIDPLFARVVKRLEQAFEIEMR